MTETRTGIEHSFARLASAGMRLAVAESLTGGLLADACVQIPGASRVFSGGVVAYDTALKASLLGVDAELLGLRGPVDGDVARQMAYGVRRLCAVPAGEGNTPLAASIGIATTGVAGPDADPQTGQPPGIVWIGVSSVRGERAVPCKFIGGRAEIRAATVNAALGELRAELDAILGEA